MDQQGAKELQAKFWTGIILLTVLAISAVTGIRMLFDGRIIGGLCVLAATYFGFGFAARLEQFRIVMDIAVGFVAVLLPRNR